MTDDEEFSVESAQAAAERGGLGDWVARFLASPGSDNAVLAEQLTDPPRLWAGPMRLPLDRLNRLAGPPDAPVLCPVDDDFWRDDVEEMADQVDGQGWTPPPVIVTFRDGQLFLEDGNHRVEGLRRADEDETWAVVGFERAEDRDAFEVPARR
jgi:hypothetical protein